MVNIELSGRLKLIKHQMKISMFKMTMVYLIKLLKVKFTKIEEPTFQM